MWCERGGTTWQVGPVHSGNMFSLRVWHGTKADDDSCLCQSWLWLKKYKFNCSCIQWLPSLAMCDAAICVPLCIYVYWKNGIYRLKIAACWHKCIDGQVRLVHLVRLLTDKFFLFFINKQKNNKLPLHDEQKVNRQKKLGFHFLLIRHVRVYVLIYVYA